MEASQAWGKSRYWAIVVVLAFHLLTIVIVVSSRSRRVLTSTTSPIEILFLPPETAARIRPPPALPNHSKRTEAAISAAPSTPTITLAPLSPSAAYLGPPIDWAEEAQTVAAAMAKSDSLQTHQGSDTTPSSQSPFAPPPTHHAGEQFRTDTGEWIVFVTDNCYQVSSPIPPSPNAIDNGMGLQTYCLGKSHTPRGDLFDQLPAYMSH
jgi:hypothetical protein